MASGLWEVRAQAVVEPEFQVSLKGGIPSFQSFDNNITGRGRYLELYKILSRELNIPIEVKPYPYARTLEYLKTGELDLAILFKNPGLNGYVDYVGKLALSQVLVISQKGLPIKSYEDLYKLKRIAVIRKASYEARFDKDQNLNKVEVENYQQEILLLQSHRVEAIVGSELGLQFAIDQIGADPREWEDPFILGYKEVWVHFSNRSDQKAIIPALRKAVDRLFRTNALFELSQ